MKENKVQIRWTPISSEKPMTDEQAAQILEEQCNKYVKEQAKSYYMDFDAKIPEAYNYVIAALKNPIRRMT